MCKFTSTDESTKCRDRVNPVKSTAFAADAIPRKLRIKNRMDELKYQREVNAINGDDYE